MTLLWFASGCQQLIAYNHRLLDVLSEFGASRIRIHLDFNSRFVFCIATSSEGRPKLFVLPFVEIIEDITSRHISEANVCDLRRTVALES